ncbi:MAG: NAD-dependent epimerase/dehydratase family protein [Phascolarctobacterium sp.]|uniref:NAD-dependent epimerase/dehydratase family protein n=1 Tax=Phascolarctobacterium sp. TaxID=2049039 RepID=UPI0026DAC787|nr:NAD-dependent epimerase/dehydratase family protein [Phascolarctobacterium sp.]MDO4921596.1 NAD-dependent epimerase/dehydratase family protein [Phascolarctobacterium sp.]
MKCVLITGATSFIGKNLVERLYNEEHKIYALVRPSSNNFTRLENCRNLNIVNLDISEISALHKYVDRIDLCYHLAWDGTRNDSRYDANLQKSNYKYSIDTYEVVKMLGCHVFVGVGSQAEYGFCQNEITESTEPNPNTEYGRYKLATCKKLIELGERDSIRVIWGRVFSIYGKGDYENTLLMSSIRKMLNNDPIDMTEGTQYWNYLYVEDLAKILVKLAYDNSARGIYNLASNDTRMLKDYILELKEIIKSKSKINFGAVPYRSEGKVSIMPNIEKLSRIYDIKNLSAFKNNIASMVLAGNF